MNRIAPRHGFVLLSLALVGCGYAPASRITTDERRSNAETMRDAPPRPSARLDFDFGPAFSSIELDSSTTSSDLPLAMRDGAPAIAFCQSVSDAAARDALVTSAEPYRFASHRGPNAAAARALLSDVVAAAAIHRVAIERRVATYLPDDSGPLIDLRIVVVIGMPEGFQLSSFEDDLGRGVLLDAAALAAAADAKGVSRRDRIGDTLDRWLAPQLFVAAHDALAERRGDGLRTDDFARMQRALLVEGVADHLARPFSERFDEQGRRPPSIDAKARIAFDHFPEKFFRVLDPATPKDEHDALLFTFSNGPRDERWGALVGSFMIDAIDAFSPRGRMREVVAKGPHELMSAYAEVCSGHSAIPRLDIKTQALLSQPPRSR